MTLNLSRVRAFEQTIATYDKEYPGGSFSENLLPLLLAHEPLQAVGQCRALALQLHPPLSHYLNQYTTRNPQALFSHIEHYISQGKLNPCIQHLLIALVNYYFDEITWLQDMSVFPHLQKYILMPVWTLREQAVTGTLQQLESELSTDLDWHYKDWCYQQLAGLQGLTPSQLYASAKTILKNHRIIWNTEHDAVVMLFNQMPARQQLDLIKSLLAPIWANSAKLVLPDKGRFIFSVTLHFKFTLTKPLPERTLLLRAELFQECIDKFIPSLNGDLFSKNCYLFVWMCHQLVCWFPAMASPAVNALYQSLLKLRLNHTQASILVETLIGDCINKLHKEQTTIIQSLVPSLDNPYTKDNAYERLKKIKPAQENMADILSYLKNNIGGHSKKEIVSLMVIYINQLPEALRDDILAQGYLDELFAKLQDNYVFIAHEFYLLQPLKLSQKILVQKNIFAAYFDILIKSETGDSLLKTLANYIHIAVDVQPQNITIVLKKLKIAHESDRNNIISLLGLLTRLIPESRNKLLAALPDLCNDKNLYVRAEAFKIQLHLCKQLNSAVASTVLLNHLKNGVPTEVKLSILKAFETYFYTHCAENNHRIVNTLWEVALNDRDNHVRQIALTTLAKRTEGTPDQPRVVQVLLAKFLAAAYSEKSALGVLLTHIKIAPRGSLYQELPILLESHDPQIYYTAITLIVKLSTCLSEAENTHLLTIMLAAWCFQTFGEDAIHHLLLQLDTATSTYQQQVLNRLMSAYGGQIIWFARRNMTFSWLDQYFINLPIETLLQLQQTSVDISIYICSLFSKKVIPEEYRGTVVRLVLNEVNRCVRADRQAMLTALSKLPIPDKHLPAVIQVMFTHITADNKDPAYQFLLSCDTPEVWSHCLTVLSRANPQQCNAVCKLLRHKAIAPTLHEPIEQALLAILLQKQPLLCESAMRALLVINAQALSSFRVRVEQWLNAPNCSPTQKLMGTILIQRVYQSTYLWLKSWKKHHHQLPKHIAAQITNLLPETQRARVEQKKSSNSPSI